MRKLFILLGVALAFHASAANKNMFDTESDGTRIEHVVYKENRVIKIGGILNDPFLIEFSERLEDVGGGAIANWEIIKRDSRLFVRALPGATKTTVLVVSKTRSYVFDFVPMLPTATNIENRRSKIVFDYPAPPVVVAAKPVEAPLPRPVTYRNDNYAMEIVSEAGDIRPREAYDDGRFTYFKFPKNLEIPAIYRSIPGTKEEWLVNSHRDGDYTVMHAVSPLWNLRLTGSTIGVFNESYDAEGVPPENGSATYGLTRTIKK